MFYMVKVNYFLLQHLNCTLKNDNNEFFNIEQIFPLSSVPHL